MAEGGFDSAESTRRDKLTQASHKLAEAMYKSQSAGGPNGAAGVLRPEAGPEPGQEKPKDDVVDAEFVDVDDKK